MDLKNLDHYDPTAPDFIAALEEVRDNPELRDDFLTGIRAEETRLRLSQGDVVRGVQFGGMGGTLHNLLPPAAVLAAVKRQKANRDAFKQTDDYRYLRAVIAVEAYLGQIAGLADMARAAYDRGFPLNAEKAAHLCSDMADKLNAAHMEANAAFVIAEKIRSDAYEAGRRQS